jgi:hypothetical protein
MDKKALPIGRILVTALVAAVLDALAAIVIYDVNPSAMFKFIASGAFGKSAFSAGPEMIWLGVLFHFLIALSWCTLYFVACPALKLYKHSPFIVIPAYGVTIWLFMNMAVLRLSRIGAAPFELSSALTGAAILVFAVSLPVVLSANRYYTDRRA